MAKSLKSTQVLVNCAMLTALCVVLSRFASISAWNIRIGFSFLASALAGMLYGPVGGALVDGAADLIGSLLFPSGAFFPGFTLTMALRGLLYGLFLHRTCDLPHVLPPVLIYQLGGAAMLNSLWIALLYGTEFRAVLVSRLPQVALMIPVQTISLLLLGRATKRLRGMVQL